jgi:ribosomal protein S18 acetylase RimI-like enzyme
MSGIKYQPISLLDERSFIPLMDEEEHAWMSDLGWDYSPIRQILVSFINQKLLPGFGAARENELLGYTYFLVNQSKGIIGAIYASKASPLQEIVENLISLTISALKNDKQIKRVESQIMPFNGVNLTDCFIPHGFQHYRRHYLNLNLGDYRPARLQTVEKLAPWNSTHLRQAAEMTAISYRDQTDAVMCEDYRTLAGCESYLRSLVENPGCGVFMPETSFMCLDEHQSLCGFVMGCQISKGVGMIPQIAVHPSFQGRGVGNALVQRSFERYRQLGFHTVTLTVTEQNWRAAAWYQRLGFKTLKEFGAYIWER